jgi:nucleotide-binding universal stress UspA family protein
MAEHWDTNSIVIGVDGSEQAEHAVAVAADIARQSGATLTFVTVVRPPEGWWGIVGSPPTPSAVSDAIADAQRDVLEGALAEVDLEGIEHKVRTAIGDPARELLVSCVEEEADLLIIGKRGAGLLERMMLGSVANRVANHAPIPLLIVP